MLPVPVLLLSCTVCFISPYPDSLPQLFLRCLLPVFTFRIFPVLSAFFRPLLSRFRLLCFVPFRSLFFPFRQALAFRCSVSLSVPCLFPFSRLISHPFLPVFGTWLSVSFLSSVPVSLPQLFHRCFSFGFLLGDRCLAFPFFRQVLALASHYSASVLPFPTFFPFSPYSGLFRCS